MNASCRAPLPLEEIRPLLADLSQRLTEVSTCSTLVAQVLIELQAGATAGSTAPRRGSRRA